MGDSKQTWPRGNGIGKLIRSKNWSETPLGPIEGWPQSLKTTVDLILSCKFPKLALWGPKLIQIYNNGYRTIMGDKHPDGLGQPIQECWPEIWDLNKPIYERIRNGESVTVKEKKLRIPRNGHSEDAWFDLCSSPLHDESGAVAGVLVTLFETTDRIRAGTGQCKATEILPENEAHLNAIIETTPECIKVVAADGTLLQVNQAGLAMVGAESASDVVGKSVYDLIAPSDRDEFQAFNERICQGENGMFQFDIIGLNGARRHMETHAAPLRNPDGTIVQLALTRDITERKQAEQTLQKREERFRTMMEQSPISMQIFDAEGRTIAVNSAWEHLWDASSEELADYNIFKDEQLKEAGLIPQIKKAFDGEVVKLPVTHYDPAGIGKPGRDRWIEGYIYPLTSKNGEIIEVALVHHDITAQKQSENALRKSEERYRTLFNSIDEGFCIIKVIFDENDEPIDHRFLETNPAFEKHTGFEHAVGKRIREIVPEHHEQWSEIYGRVALTGEPIRLTKRAAAFSEPKWFELYVFRVGEPEEGKVAVLFSNITERKSNELSNAFLGAIVESSDDTIISKDLDGTITSWNDSAERMFGYSAKEAISQPISILIPEERLDEESEILNQIRQGERVNHFETIRKHKDGTLLDISLTVSPIRNSKGEIVGSSKIARNITARKRTEQKLRESKERYRSVSESGLIAIAFFDTSGAITGANDAYLDLTGFTRADLDAGKIRWDRLTPPKWLPRTREAVEELEQTGQITPYEKEYARKDGSRFWALIGGSRIESTGEGVAFVLDITKRKQAEKKLRKNKEHFRLAVNVADLGIWSYDPNTDLVHLDERMRAMWGVTNASLPLLKVIERIHPDDRAQVLRQINTILDLDTSDNYSIEHRIVWDDGTVRWISANGQAQFDEKEGGRKAAHFFGTAFDITEWKQAEQKLQKMNETLEKRVEKRTEELKNYQTELRSLASQLTQAEEKERHRLAAELHDNLGQMLTVAKINLDTLESADLSDDILNELYDTKKLIDDSITFTRELMTELKPPPVLNKEDTGEILAWVSKKMEKQHGLEVTIEDDREPKPISEDTRTALHQCVRELLFNIVKHAGVNEARLILSRLNGQVKATVEDEGRGIDLKAKEPIPTEEGGLGLFNIRERMSWLGGRLEIHSEPGQGTKATLYAPLKDVDEEKTNSVNEQISPPPDKPDDQTELWQQINVLLVDDHEMVRRGFRKMIEGQDDMTIIAEAADGEEAVKLARETRPDVILMDVNMPGMDGIEATRQIISGGSNARIIGLSLHDGEEVVRNMQSAGASAYLTKDEAFETLCKTIRSEARTGRAVS